MPNLPLPLAEAQANTPRRVSGLKPTGRIHGIDFDDNGYVHVVDSAEFRAQFGDEATVRTAAAFIDRWDADVEAAWRRGCREFSDDAHADRYADEGGVSW
jgi:hypothetical protein